MRRCSSRIGNRGSAAVEASLVVPIFLLAMVYLYLTFQSVLADALVYEAASETAEYMAEMSYVEAGNVAVAYLKFPGYVDEKETIEQHVKGGSAGVSFIGSDMGKETHWVELRVAYTPKFAQARSYKIRQRAYVGNEQPEEDGNATDEEVYVYVTEHQQVYHRTRNCTHLRLSIRISPKKAAKKQGYRPCELCGDESGDIVYVTDEGRKYHGRNTCSGLKRTVYRKKQSEVQGLGPCSRCGGE